LLKLAQLSKIWSLRKLCYLRLGCWKIRSVRRFFLNNFSADQYDWFGATKKHVKIRNIVAEQILNLDESWQQACPSIPRAQFVSLFAKVASACRCKLGHRRLLRAACLRCNRIEILGGSRSNLIGSNHSARCNTYEQEAKKRLKYVACPSLEKQGHVRAILALSSRPSRLHVVPASPRRNYTAQTIH
jgi:hypothetical protein